MENQDKRKIDLEPIYTFLTEDINPADFAGLLDELMHSYILLLIRSQQAGKEDLPEHVFEFFHYLKTLRDILPLCEKK